MKKRKLNSILINHENVALDLIGRVPATEKASYLYLFGYMEALNNIGYEINNIPLEADKDHPLYAVFRNIRRNAIEISKEMEDN